RAHREDIAQDSTDAGSGPLKRLDEARMVVRLDLERHSKARADIDHAGVFPRPLQNARPLGGQFLEMHPRALIRAVLAPHHAEGARRGEGGVAAQEANEGVVLLGRELMLRDDLSADGGHVGATKMAVGWWGGPGRPPQTKGQSQRGMTRGISPQRVWRTRPA